jgi:hypothetical protein
MLKPSPRSVVVAVGVGLVLLLFSAWLSGFHGEICEQNKSGQEQCTVHNLAILIFFYVGRFLENSAVVVTALATGIIGYFTYTLSQSTKNMWSATQIAAVAAQKSAEVLPVIEGAYVYPDILGENIASNLQNLAHPMVTSRALRLEFQFKNFGKTPAILHHFQADLIHFDQGHMRSKDAEGRIAKKIVLGAGEAEKLQTEIGDFGKEEAASVMAGHTRLSFTGYVVYGDVFGNKWGYSFDWEFSPTQGRLVPDNQPRKKIE